MIQRQRIVGSVTTTRRSMVETYPALHQKVGSVYVCRGRCNSFEFFRIVLLVIIVLLGSGLPGVVSSFSSIGNGIIIPRRGSVLLVQPNRQQQQSNSPFSERRGWSSLSSSYRPRSLIVSTPNTVRNNKYDDDNDDDADVSRQIIIRQQPNSLASVRSIVRTASSRQQRQKRQKQQQVPLGNGLSTRRFVVQTALASIVSGYIVTATPTVANAVAVQRQAPIITSAVCDPTVSVWSLPSGTTTASPSRIVYLLGTAHISDVSAELAQRLVQDVHPNAVFVELDIKRVGGIVVPAVPNSPATPTPAATTTTTVSFVPTPTKNAVEVQFSTPNIDGDDAAGSSSSTLVSPLSSSKIIIPIPSKFSSLSRLQQQQQEVIADGASPSSNSVVVDVASISDSSTNDATRFLPPPPPPPAKVGFIASIQQKAFNFAAQAVGNAIKGMYQNLGKAGFNPGEEFTAAITAGQQYNADIILGDQDVDRTLRRLTQAMASTDWNQLLSPELEQQMNELLPSSTNSIPPPTYTSATATDLSPEQYKQELSEYIETIKSRTNVRRIMEQLKVVAPALVDAMVTERDAYMAAGIDTLNQYECIVAVMGIAHMDGVEQNLQSRGWQSMNLSKLCNK